MGLSDTRQLSLGDLLEGVFGGYYQILGKCP